MKITAIETYPVSIPLKKEYRMISALGKHEQSQYVIVRIMTDEGIEGVGEATVTARWSGETVWSAKSMIDRLLAPAVLGCDPHKISEIDCHMDAVATHNWFAKSAIEMACWDLQGKRACRPVYELLGGACRGLAIRGRFSMGAYDPERARNRATELVKQGFTTIKVKVGGISEQDIARVRAVRQAIGPEPALVIDANCGWDADTAIDCVNRLGDCNIALVEQPTPDGDYAALAKVRQNVTPEIMADDICFNMAHARELIRNRCCDVISLYPGKNGGILKAKRIAEYAARQKIACSIGSNLEWDIATAAMGHLIVATKNMQIEKYPGDIHGPEYHQVRLVKEPLSIEGPITTITDRPGLGVEVDWELVRQHVCDEHD